MIKMSTSVFLCPSYCQLYPSELIYCISTIRCWLLEKQNKGWSKEFSLYKIMCCVDKLILHI